MKKRLGKTIFAILFLLPVWAYSTNITFTSSGTITDGNTYDNVYVRNNGTVVNMSGGQIQTNLITFDSSTFNMSGGLISSSGVYITVGVNDLSTINISDGTIEKTNFVLYGSANISGGNITGNVNKANPSSILNITGGNLIFGDFYIYGTLNISGGLLNIDNPHFPSTSVNIFGYGFNYDPVGQVLTGYLLDHNHFTINHLNSLDYQHLNLVPEPMSLLIFGIGLLAIRNHKK